MKKKRVHGVPGHCVFCAKVGSLSKEHLWPEWMHGIVRLPGDRHANNYLHTVGNKTQGLLSRREQEKQGHVTTRKFRVVCKVCNETWMSSIEEAAKPVLTPLISGQSGSLTQQMQATFAEWVTLKTMVAEQNQPDEEVFSAMDRAAFKNERTIPPGTRIWIARTFSQLWRNAYLRNSAQLALSDSFPPKVVPSHERKNVQTSAFGVGELFIYTTVSKAEGIDIKDLIRVEDHLVPVYPYSEEFELPLRFIVTEGIATSIAFALHRLMNSEHVHHFDIPA